MHLCAKERCAVSGLTWVRHLNLRRPRTLQSGKIVIGDSPSPTGTKLLTHVRVPKSLTPTLIDRSSSSPPLSKTCYHRLNVISDLNLAAFQADCSVWGLEWLDDRGGSELYLPTSLIGSEPQHMMPASLGRAYYEKLPTSKSRLLSNTS